MITETKDPNFESTFNEWYQNFLREEKKVNELIKSAKKQREEKIEKARLNAIELLKQYDTEQREILEAQKNKVFF